MRLKLLFVAIVMTGSSVACATFLKKQPPLPTVASLDLDRYVGKWYTISALPQFFTRKCVAQTADYAVLDSNKISVLNTCIKKDGSITDIEGFAKTTDAAGILRLQFTEGFPGFFGIKANYNIILLSLDYSVAMVGGRDRKTLWFLSRTKTVSRPVYNRLMERAEELGYNTSKMVDSKF